jgi:ribosomal protein L35
LFHPKLISRNFSVLPWICNNNASSTVLHPIPVTKTSSVPTTIIPIGRMILPNGRQQQQQLQVRNKHSFKTHKGVAKRIRVRGKGKLVRNKVGHQHNTGHLRRASKNKRGCSTTSIGDKKMEKKYRIVLGVLGKK